MFLRGQTIGKYRVLSHLGSGGFGSVYLAEDTWIEKNVAIKVPHKQNLDFSEMLKEPRLLASMSHPNIVTMLTAEKLDDVFFIVLEYVPGETLEHLIIREGALELARAFDYTCQMCNAVDHAHRAGVLHRDIRPGNMLVSETGLLKVTDFGTSRFLEIAAHGTTVIGSPPYMAPEQFHGKAVFASDVYSIGITMYQMVTGELPYHTPAPADIEKLMRGELVTSVAREEPAGAEGHQRHHHARARARSHRSRISAPATCSRICSRPARPSAAAPRAGEPPSASTSPTPTWRTFSRASRHAKRRRHASAGSAASRSTRAPTGARSVTKSQ